MTDLATPKPLKDQTISDLRPSDAKKLRQQLLAISDVVRDLAGEFELEPLLEKIISRSLDLSGYSSGSISLVDEGAGSYTKKVDSGVVCQAGLTFPLSEGITGAVVRARQPVIFEAYSQVPGGHIAHDDPRWECAVMGVPLARNDTIIGSLVVFGATPGEAFSADDAMVIELFARHATVAILNSQLHNISAERAKSAAVSDERERANLFFRDSINTMLTDLVIESQKAAGSKRNAKEEPEQVVAKIREMARTALLNVSSDTEGGILGLNSRNLSFEDDVKQEVAWLVASTELHTEVHVLGGHRPLAPEVHHHAFRVVQEALSNIARHSGATTARVGIIFNSESVSLVIEDNGKGFDVAAAHANHSSLRPTCLGLHDMASRISRLNGDFSIDSTPSWGTTVRCQIADSGLSNSNGPANHRWKIIVATPIQLVSAGLRSLLSLHEPTIQVAAEVHSLEQFHETVSLVQPDLIAVDLSILTDEYLRVIQELRVNQPNLPLVGITGNPTPDELYESSRVGITSFLRLDSSPQKIVRTLVAAVQGTSFVDEGLLEKLRDYLHPELALERPSEREQDVLRLIGGGVSNKEIAAELHISIKTVEKHVSSLLRKSGASNRTMLANLYAQKIRLY